MIGAAYSGRLAAILALHVEETNAREILDRRRRVVDIYIGCRGAGLLRCCYRRFAVGMSNV